MSEGYGYPVTQLLPEQLTAVLKYLYASLLINNIEITLPKYSVLFFYARVFKRTSRMLWISLYLVGAYATAWLLYSSILLVCLCRPIRKSWLPMTPGHCLQTFNWYLSQSLLSVFIDFVIMLLPLPTIWKLHTGRKRKSLLTGLFICGYW